MVVANLLGRWFPGSLEESLFLLVDALVCLGTATVCGFIVGREREFHHKPAGTRTHILVCVGAAAFVHLGVVSFTVAGLGTIADFNRLIQSIATGIGFLGAGAIFRAGNTAHGVTTAASIWFIGAAGAAAGGGAVTFALLITLIAYFVLRSTGEAEVFEEILEGPEDVGEEA